MKKIIARIWVDRDWLVRFGIWFARGDHNRTLSVTVLTRQIGFEWGWLNPGLDVRVVTKQIAWYRKS